MKNLTEIVCVLDRSGSMASILDDAIGGFNTFLQSQQEIPGEAVMSIVLFDNEYEMLYSGKTLAGVPPFNRQTFVPRGSTALYDALGKTIQDVGARLAGLPESERPNKVLFVILTDGHENASQKYTSSQIQQMITHQRTVYSWEFIFLAANQDAFAVSESIGIAKGNSMNFEANSVSTGLMYRKMNMATAKFRSDKFDKSMRNNLMDDFTDEPEDSDKPAK